MTHEKLAMPEWFRLKSAHEKIRSASEAIAEAMRQTQSRRSFNLPGRDVGVVAPSELPPKPGLALIEGQARLLHDLGNIELQAMEMMIRTLFEYPEAPADFRSELAEIALAEARHLGLCLNALESLEHRWGDWNVHLSLWNAIGPEDELLDRILIVHRYLEGSGLDAGDSILRRLVGVQSREVRQAVRVIVHEELGHVEFGSRWYRKIAEKNHLDPEREFATRMPRIARITPRRERIAREVRLQAGFSEGEIAVLEECRREAIAAGPSRVR